MKAVAGQNRNGKWRGSQGMMAVVAMALLAFTIIVAGCGGGSGNSTTASQLNRKSTGTTGKTVASKNKTGTTATVPGVNGNQQVLAGYTADQCMSDLTTRYGSSDVAAQACAQINKDYGSSVPRSQLTTTVLPKIEQQHPNWKPVQPGTPSQSPSPSPSQPPSGGQTPSGGSGGTSTGGWSGGGIPITVPGQPGGNGP